MILIPTGAVQRAAVAAASASLRGIHQQQRRQVKQTGRQLSDVMLVLCCCGRELQHAACPIIPYGVNVALGRISLPSGLGEHGGTLVMTRLLL